MKHNAPWNSIFEEFKVAEHDFSRSPFLLSGEMIKMATAKLTKTGEREMRVFCKQDSRNDRPQVFVSNDLFILPKKNGVYYLVQGEGYVDLPDIASPVQNYASNLDFPLETSKIGDSEMQHLDFAYASSLIRHYMQDPSLVLTIRGRKYTPKFAFFAGRHHHYLEVESVQTKVDAGYEGREQIVLIEAKNSSSANVIIRRLYYPYRQWQEHTRKKVTVVFLKGAWICSISGNLASQKWTTTTA